MKAQKLTTGKAQRAYALSKSEELQKLEEDIIVAEAEKMLVCGMVKSSEQLLNALKKARPGREF